LEDRLFSTMSFTFHLGNQFITLVALTLYLAAAHWSLALALTAGIGLFMLLRIRILREQFLLARKQTEPQRRLAYFATLMTGREAAAEARLFGLEDHLLTAWKRLHGELKEERLGLA